MTTINEIQVLMQNELKRVIQQTEIAAALGTSRANISLRMKNKSRLQINEIKKLENYFKIELIKLSGKGIENGSCAGLINPYYLKSIEILDSADDKELEYYYGLLKQGQNGIKIIKS